MRVVTVMLNNRVLAVVRTASKPLATLEVQEAAAIALEAIVRDVEASDGTIETRPYAGEFRA